MRINTMHGVPVTIGNVTFPANVDITLTNLEFAQLQEMTKKERETIFRRFRRASRGQ